MPSSSLTFSVPALSLARASASAMSSPRTNSMLPDCERVSMVEALSSAEPGSLMVMLEPSLDTVAKLTPRAARRERRICAVLFIWLSLGVWPSAVAAKVALVPPVKSTPREMWPGTRANVTAAATISAAAAPMQARARRTTRVAGRRRFAPFSAALSPFLLVEAPVSCVSSRQRSTPVFWTASFFFLAM